MNFIFRSYPAHPWFTDWSFEPRGCSSAFRENTTDLFFRTEETVGRIAPSTEESEWLLQIPVPQNSRINMLFNGFCAYFEKKKARYGAEVLVPEPGVLWGRSIGIPAPVMMTSLDIEDKNEFQWIENGKTKALLAIRGDTFCLVTKARLQSDAIELAEQYFSRNVEEAITQEYERRSGARTLVEDMANHDSLAAICAESMMKTLRPAEGSIPLAWCQSSSTPFPQLDLNELYPLAMAWRLIDVEVAEELVSCVLRLQTNAGAIPVLYAPHTTHSVLEAPKPFLAKTLEAVWEIRKDDALLSALLPLLRRHVQWLLHHFDPKRRGIHCWKNRTEPIIPELYETDMASVDLTVLLLTEIEALNRLRSTSSAFGADSDYFAEDKATLEHNLLNQFWNDQESAFSNAYIRDKVLPLKGFPAFTPLLWNKLPNQHRSSILELVHESGTLPGGLSVLSWRKSALDDSSFPLLQQMLVFQALKTADPHGQLLRDFSRVTLQGFVEWHTLSLQQDKQLPVNPVTAAYIINVQSMHQYRYYGRGRISGILFKMLNKAKADRFDLIVIAATAFALYSSHLIYSVLRTPPPLAMLEAEMNSGYANKDPQSTLENCIMIIKHYPEKASTARLLAANISMLQSDLVNAVELYKAVREQSPDSPGPMIALGLAYQMQGKFKEAEKNYFEFCYIFEEIFPELVQEVNHYRYLIQEGFAAPPKWQEIYRYQLMHEL